MKIYLAGKWTDKAGIREKMARIQALGHTITHDWTKAETQKTLTQMKLYAGLDVKGVIEADIVILLFEDNSYAYRGTFTELGVALGQRELGFRKEIWVVCPDADAYATTNVFFHHDYIKHFNSWDVCYKALSGWTSDVLRTDRR